MLVDNKIKTKLLRRMGAQRCGHSLVIGRGLLMARLREAHENHDWRWESERRQSVERVCQSETAGGASDHHG